MRALRPILDHVRRRVSFSEQEGSLLIEVMVGAVVLAITTFAVLDGLEGAQKTGLKNKSRSVSATLAQQDIERLRAFPITSLSNYRETRTVDVAGASYTVTSRTDWVRDASGLVSCTDDTTQADYMKISSTVHSAVSVDRPVKEVSLLTPAPGAFSTTAGTAAVKLTDRDGNPHSGVSVSLGGPGSFSDTTNSLGCAIFGFVPAGDYEVEVNGLVGWGGAGFPAGELTVVAAKTSLKALEVDVPASLRAIFELPPAGVLPINPAWSTPAGWSSISAANAKVPGAAKQFTAGSAVTSIDGTGLFPFLDGYGVYAGGCRANNPAFHQTEYFQTSGKGFAQLDPGDALETVPVQMGAQRVTVTNPNGSSAGVGVTVRQGDTGIGCNRDLLIASGTTGSDGTADFVLPFGTYRLCASGTVGTRIRFKETGGSGNPAHPRLAPPDRLAQSVTLALPSSGSGGACSTVTDTSP